MSNLCDWCGALTPEDSELCVNCLAAQKAVEKGQLITKKPKKQLPANTHPVAVSATNVALFITRLAVFTTLGVLMVAAGLFGTCSALVTVLTVGSSAWVPFLFAALLGFGVAYLLYKCAGWANEAIPTQIKQAKPPAIEKRDDWPET